MRGSMKDKIKAFCGGILFTVILVVVVPLVTTIWMQPFIEGVVYSYIEKEAESLGIAIFSSSAIISGILFILALCFGFLFGGGAILRNFGVIGVLGLIFGYWLLGNPYGAIMPVATLILFAILKQLWIKYSEKRKARKERKKWKKEKRKEKKKARKEKKKSS